MARLALAFGVVLVLLGAGLWVGTGRESTTALIPAFFGAGFVLCGLWARSPRWRMHAMHVAALLALGGFLGTLGVMGPMPGLLGAAKSLTGGEALERPPAAYGQAAMCLLCLAFLVLCVRSFIAARKAREAAGG